MLEIWNLSLFLDEETRAGPEENGKWERADFNEKFCEELESRKYNYTIPFSLKNIFEISV